MAGRLHHPTSCAPNINYSEIICLFVNNKHCKLNYTVNYFNKILITCKFYITSTEISITAKLNNYNYNDYCSTVANMNQMQDIVKVLTYLV